MVTCAICLDRPLNEGLPTKGRRGPTRPPWSRPRPPLNEGLPTKGRRVAVFGESIIGDDPSTKASPRRGGERQRRIVASETPSPQRRPPHEGEASGGAGAGERPRLTPQRRPPHEGEARSTYRRLPALMRVPQRRPPHEGEASALITILRKDPVTLNEGLPTKGRRALCGDLKGHSGCPQRRPPHEGEARHADEAPTPGSGHPSTKASPRRGGEWGGLGRVIAGDAPQRRPPHEGEASAFMMDATSVAISPSTKASPRRGGEFGTANAGSTTRPPSTKASPRRGGERSCLFLSHHFQHPQRRPPHEGEASQQLKAPAPPAAIPQRRPPHEGEASDRLRFWGCLGCHPQRRPPHEGEARRCRPPAPGSSSRPSTKASPRRGGEPLPHGSSGSQRVPSTKASPRRGGEGRGRP